MKVAYDKSIIFKQGFELIPIPTCLVDYGGKFKAVNNSLSLYLGYSEKELENLDWPSITVRDYLEADLENVKNCFAGKIDNYIMYKEYIAKNGAKLPSKLCVSILREHSVFFCQIVPIGRDL